MGWFNHLECLKTKTAEAQGFLLIFGVGPFFCSFEHFLSLTWKWKMSYKIHETGACKIATIRGGKNVLVPWIQWEFSGVQRFNGGKSLDFQPTIHKLGGGGFKHFLFSPLPGEMIQFD